MRRDGAQGRGIVLAALLLCGCLVREDDGEVSRAALVGGDQAVVGEWSSALYWVIQGGSCGGVRVGPRQILTAAHCVQVIDYNVSRMYGTLRGAMAPGSPLKLTYDKQLDAQTAYWDYVIERVEMHPDWVSSCEPSCPYDNAMRAPFPPDLALITVREDLPMQLATARVLSGPLLPGAAVSITGYGCEDGVGMGFRQPGKLKFFDTHTLDASALRHLNSFVPSTQVTLFERHAVITPGQDLYGEASLCSADSGSPLYLTDTSQGEVVVGVNSYYSFRNAAAGISTTNAHTRLGGDNPSAALAWLAQRIPMTSLHAQAPAADLAALDRPTRFDRVLGGDDQDETLSGGEGSERVEGRGGEDWLRGEGGDDQLEGGDQSDWLEGGAGRDVLFGEAGGDVLDGGPGEDLLYGGPGPDLYLVTPGMGHDLVIDAEGQNRVICQGFVEPLEVTRHGADWVVMSASREESLRLVGSRVVTFYGCD